MREAGALLGDRCRGAEVCEFEVKQRQQFFGGVRATADAVGTLGDVGIVAARASRSSRTMSAIGWLLARPLLALSIAASVIGGLAGDGGIQKARKDASRPGEAEHPCGVAL